MARNISPDVYRRQRQEKPSFFCDLCSDRWPISMRRFQTPYRVGPCCYESFGGSLDRDLRRAAASRYGAQQGSQEIGIQPPVGPDGIYYVGVGIGSGGPLESAITDISPLPVTLTAGGVAVAVTVTGVGFTAADAFVYGNVEIVDNVAPVLASGTEWDLSVKALAGLTPGLYSLTFNGSLWQAVFDVR